MLILTQGIVLRTVNYSENSVIVTIYTRLSGLGSYMLKGVGASSKKKKNKQNLLQPLSLVEMSAYHKPTGNLQHIKELRLSYVYKNIPSDLIKTSVFLFLHEIIYLSIKEEGANEALFLFLSDSLIELDKTQQNVSGFHLYFLYKLSQQLGFAPLNNFSDQRPVFNLVEGCFQKSAPEHSHFLDRDLSKCFYHFLCCNNGENGSLTLSYSDRKQLLGKLIEYYQLHLTGTRKIQSAKILEELLR